MIWLAASVNFPFLLPALPRRECVDYSHSIARAISCKSRNKYCSPKEEENKTAPKNKKTNKHMQHIPCSWEKEYTFQPNLRAAKDDWQTATRPTYMYPPRPSPSSLKRNDARFVQASTLGMVSHRHPVGLPKSAVTGQRAAMGSFDRPRTVDSASSALVGDRPPTSQAGGNVVNVTKSAYRASSTPSGAHKGGRVGIQSQSLRPATASVRANAADSRVGARVKAAVDTSYYSVVPADGRDRSELADAGREFSTLPRESRERMYKESVRDRRNEHLRSGLVEPEWERQRIVMDVVGAKSADNLIEQGYDQRYRPAGGLIDVRRGRRVLSARDRAAMTHDLFPENYADGTALAGGLGNTYRTQKPKARVRVPPYQGNAAERDTAEGVIVAGMEDDRRDAQGALASYGRLPPRMYADDRLSEVMTRQSMAARYADDLPEVLTSAAHREGMYTVPNTTGPVDINSTFNTIASKYTRQGAGGLAGGAALNTSYYPHPQGRPLGPSPHDLYVGSEVSVYQGRNGPVLVADVHGAAQPPPPAVGAYLGSEPVLSPPRRDTSGFNTSSAGVGGYGGRAGDLSPLERETLRLSRSCGDNGLGGRTPNVLDRTANHDTSLRVLPGRRGPIIVEEDFTPRPTPRFHDDRDVYVPAADEGRGASSYLRLSPNQVREAQRQLDRRGNAENGESAFVAPFNEASFANPVWARRLSGGLSANVSMASPQPPNASAVYDLSTLPNAPI